MREVLESESVKERASKFQTMGETVALERFFKEVIVCQDKVTYGPKSVALALEQSAVETLLISDKLFRSKNTKLREHYVKVYEKAQGQA